MKNYLFALFILMVNTVSGQSTLKVSLITVAPGSELYSAFGHSCLWLQDTTTGIDRVYNYGTFDFRTEGFYWKFLRGILPYQLSVAPLDFYDPRYSQLQYWKAENRSIHEQILRLSSTQKEKLFAFLEQNYLPENRTYQYKFYYDNCSTRLRDALVYACRDSLKLDTFGTTQAPLTGRSFRQWMNLYLKDQPFAQLGMNLAIGIPSDAQASGNQAAYLPDNLKFMLENSKITTPLGVRNLVEKEQSLFVSSPNESNTFWHWSAMILVFSGLFYGFRTGLFGKKTDVFIFIFLGIMGLVLVFLWLGTSHGVTNWNPALLVCNPLFLLGFNKQKNLLVFTAISALVLALVGGFFQGITTPYFYGLMALVAWRCWERCK